MMGVVLTCKFYLIRLTNCLVITYLISIWNFKLIMLYFWNCFVCMLYQKLCTFCVPCWDRFSIANELSWTAHSMKDAAVKLFNRGYTMHFFKWSMMDVILMFDDFTILPPQHTGRTWFKIENFDRTNNL